MHPWQHNWCRGCKTLILMNKPAVASQYARHCNMNKKWRAGKHHPPLKEDNQWHASSRARHCSYRPVVGRVGERSNFKKIPMHTQDHGDA